MTAQQFIWDDFTTDFDFDALRKKCRIKEGARHETVLRELIDEAAPVARPKAVIRVLTPTLIDDGPVRLDDDVEIDSPLMHKHLTGQSLAFAFVATCGTELNAWSKTQSGVREFLAAEVMIQALRQGRMQTEERLCEQFGLTMVSAMNPGSLPNEWPITGQIDLFRLLGDLPGRIGVELLPSLLMNPPKSSSGLIFPTAEKFHNCHLCPKYDCPERRC